MPALFRVPFGLTADLLFFPAFLKETDKGEIAVNSAG
jgi:hypothetical protein